MSYARVPDEMIELQRVSSGEPPNESQIPVDSVENYWKAIFAKYDHDNDGRIPVGEFSDALRDNTMNKNIPKHVIDKIVARSDQNRDNFITFPEFLSMIETKEGRILLKSYISKYIHHTIPVRQYNIPDGEYEEQYSCNPPAVCMLIVSIFEIATFTYDYSVTGYDNVDGPTATQLIYNPHRRKEAWRFMTYMFVHLGSLHLFVNLVVQILLGIPLEMVHGWWRVLIVYVSGVIAGSLGTSISDPNVYLAGASGGVYALITAHLATLIMNWSEMEFAVWQLLVFLFLCGIDVGSAVYTRYVLDEKTQVGYAAHFAGAVAGLLVGLYVLRNLEVHSWEKKIWWSALVIYALFLCVAITWNIALPEYFPYQSV